MGDVDNGGGCVCVLGAEGMVFGKSLYLPLNFATNLKLLFKKIKPLKMYLFKNAYL